jgi:hypothetical protein
MPLQVQGSAFKVLRFRSILCANSECTQPHEGKPVLLDANKTPGAARTPVFFALGPEWAKGIQTYLCEILLSEFGGSWRQFY